MRFSLKTLFCLVAIVATLLATNARPTILLDGCSVYPCINVAFHNPPQELIGRVPGPRIAGAALRTFNQTELIAKGATVKRGWPLEFQNDKGFRYPLKNGGYWIGLPDILPESLLWRISFWRLFVNVLIVSSAIFMLVNLPNSIVWPWRAWQRTRLIISKT